MNENLTFLQNCILFKKFSIESIEKLIENIEYSIKSYEKNEVVAIEGSNCSNIGIVINGCVEIQKIYASGKLVTITKITSAQIFGEVIIFSNHNTYPATIVASTKTKVMFISKENILKLSSIDTEFLNNFMSLLSNKILILNKKVKLMSYQTIRQKIANYLLEEHKKIGTLKIKLNCSKKELSEHLGIPRPSLSRELINMREEGLITFDKNIIEILNVDLIEEALIE